MQITIKTITHEEKISRNNKPFTSCRITVFSQKENKDITISGFGSSITKTWQAGDIVEVDLSQTEQGYWNFSENENSKPSPDKKLLLLQEINRKLDLLVGSKETTLGDIEKAFNS